MELHEISENYKNQSQMTTNQIIEHLAKVLFNTNELINQQQHLIKGQTNELKNICKSMLDQIVTDNEQISDFIKKNGSEYDVDHIPSFHKQLNPRNHHSIHNRNEDMKRERDRQRERERFREKERERSWRDKERERDRRPMNKEQRPRNTSSKPTYQQNYKKKKEEIIDPDEDLDDF